MEINLSSLTPLARLRDVRSRDRTFWCLALKRSGIDVHACLDSLRHTRWMFVPSSTRLFVASRHKYPRPLGPRYTSRGTSTKRFRCANRRPSRKYDVANKVETTNSLFSIVDSCSFDRICNTSDRIYIYIYLLTFVKVKQRYRRTSSAWRRKKDEAENENELVTNGF